MKQNPGLAGSMLGFMWAAVFAALVGFGSASFAAWLIHFVNKPLADIAWPVMFGISMWFILKELMNPMKDSEDTPG